MTEDQRAMIRTRGRFLLGGFLVAMIFIGIRAVDLQISQHDKLNEEYSKGMEFSFSEFLS